MYEQFNHTADIRLWSNELYGISSDIFNSIDYFIQLFSNNYALTTTNNETYVFGEEINNWYRKSTLDSLIKQKKIDELNTKIRKIDNGRCFFACLTSNDDVYLCSAASRWQTDGHLKKISNNIKNISCGKDHLLLLRNDGHLFAQGNNKYGQLGIGCKKSHSYYEMVDTGLDNVIDISSNEYHCLALTNEFKLYAWGDNRYGQLGLNDKNERLSPTLVEIPTISSSSYSSFSIGKIKQISTGCRHSAILMEDGTLYCSGSLGYEHKIGWKIFTQMSLENIKTIASIDCWLFASTKDYYLRYNNNNDGDCFFAWTSNTTFPKVIGQAESYSKAFLMMKIIIDGDGGQHLTPPTFGWTKNI